ncbi:cell wall-associated NlpC family hydrolase [Streptomonospora nanhaiensis]|uniref:Cell wall-associated NlpC family hydrolase n=1 Tax=Streptomonospora nanhaiensis TaxID=1323731 RepID=A0A853BPK0_9ACTN|nr:C40 family peptidase [Streptomonospora nanhaiensis]NYI96645.1 cell wall-associated NlpC family hydrolase [Streptomonospora nanhaiensis]
MTESMEYGSPERGKRPPSMTRAVLTLSSLAVIAAFGLIAGPAARAEERLPQAAGIAAEAVEHAKSQVGKPYTYGAEGPGAYDCSGLVQWAYKKAGKNLSRTTYTQFKEGSSVARDNLRPGDLVFFYSGPTHVGIYIGDGQMVHASSSKDRVMIVSLSDYYDRHFTGARRVA